MAVYRQVYMKFWTDDSKVVDDFTPEDKYFFLYLMTNPHTTLTGCYEISFKVMARETGYNEETVKRLMDRMERTHKVICYDQNTKEVLIVNWHKYNWTTSEKLLQSVRNQLPYIRSERFREYVEGLIDGDTVSIPYGYGMDTSITVTDTVTDTVSISNKESKTKKFVPPTLEEVREYCEERKNNIDPEYFIDYYASQQWKKANGRPVADWKACVRQWESKEKPKKETKEEKTFDIKEYAKEQGWFD
jgi:hypothetical protein